MTVEEARGKIQESLHGRPKQQQFREALLHAYGRRCAITGCTIEEILEAAHIVPYCLDSRNHPWNGVLLRSDIHTLFDRNFLEIEPNTGCVYLHQKLQQDPLYAHLHQKAIVSPPIVHLPEELRMTFGRHDARRWREALQWRHDHYQEFLENDV